MKNRRGNFRLAVAGYWFLGVAWGYLIMKLPDAWFMIGLILSSILCGIGGWGIEKLLESCCREAEISMLKNTMGEIKTAVKSSLEYSLQKRRKDVNNT